MKKTRLMFLLFLALFSHFSLGHADGDGTQSTLAQMVSQAHAIFLGTCSSSQSRWDEAKRMIFTDSTFLVQEYLKGNLGPVVTLTEPGGVLPEWNLEMIVPDFPQFHEGEEVVLFIWTDPHGTHQVLGASRGEHNVTVEPATGKKMVDGECLEEFLLRIRAQLKAN
jgi:hypothetical protein